ncbi:hypothetical protein D3C72_2048270 [compost metagenome]
MGMPSCYARRSNTMHVVVAWAYSLPFSSSTRACAVAICLPLCISVAAARSGPLDGVAGRTMLTLSSTVV